jgi:alkylation response protein AidB-like acyl-CoA dehydrogenase
MQFGLSSEQSLLKDSVDHYLRERAPLDRVRQFANANEGRAADLVAGLAELGVCALLIPEAHGGIGLTPLDACLVAESLGYHVTPIAYAANAVMVPQALMLAGSAAQQAEWLPKIAAGRIIVGAALSQLTGARGAIDTYKVGTNAAGNSAAGDSAAGNDTAVGNSTNSSAVAVRAQNGKLSGRAQYVLDFEADAYLVADDHGGLHLVDAKASGLIRRRLETIDRTRPVGELLFDQVSADLLPGASPAICTQVLDIGRTMLAADTLGAAQNMIDQAVKYAGQREQFGRVIASFQAVKHLCAEMAAQLEPARAFVWYAGHAIGEGADDAHLVACHLKAHISEVGRFVAKTATEVHGGMGFTDLLGLHYWFKRIGLNRQLLGSPERLRLEAARGQALVA